ncbi:MAG: FtsX-like permease family protein [Acidimicrobiia bacterium]
MRRVTLKNLFARKFRLVLTSLSVVLGVAFMAGTFVLTDTLGNVFDQLFVDVNRGVDVAVRSPAAFEEQGPTGETTREPIPDTLLPTVRDVAGVRTAEGGVQGYALVVALDDRGEPGEAIQNQAPSIGVTWGPDRELNGAFGGDGRPEAGSRPKGPNQVALDEVTAEDAGISAKAVERCAASGACEGSRVQMVFLEQPPQIFDVVGIFKFGTVGNLAGATLTAFDTATAQTVMNRAGQFDEIRIAADGISQQELRRRVADAVNAPGGPRYEILTGEQLAADTSEEIKQNLAFFSTFMLVFAFIALFVGAFIIYNTFSIIVAQRARELGLLRALGASGRQVMGSVALEALVVGLISSVLGLVVGIAVAIGLQGLMNAIGFELPSGGLVVATRTIIVSVIVGTVITLVSAIGPARRAARVSPMDALRTDATVPTSGRRRFVLGAIVATIGAALMTSGLAASEGSIESVGFGALLVFLGVAMLSPLLAPSTSRMLGWFPARVRGMSGVLARENALRNPRRTASTAAALMIGLALVSVVAIFGASVKQTLGDVLETDLKAEFLLTTDNFSPISPEAAQAVRDALPASTVTEFRFGQFELGAETKALLGVDRNLGTTLDVHPRAGALERWRADGGFLLYKDAFRELPARSRAAREIEVRFANQPAGATTTVPIAGVFDKKDAIGNDYLLAMPDFEATYTDQADVFIAVKIPSGTTVAAARRAIDAALVPYPNVEAKDQAEFKESQEAQIDQFLNLMYMLLLLAVVIALIGIVNTLALSIFERTRELGLLRAVGMTRRQLRRMIRYEATIIAVFGSLLGLALGIAFGVAMVTALKSEGINLALPLGQLVIFLVLAGIAGLVAGIPPARRAARLDVLEAISHE